MPIQRLLSTTQVKEHKKAGAELCQAQVKLGLAKSTLLKLRSLFSSTVYSSVDVLAR